VTGSRQREVVPSKRLRNLHRKWMRQPAQDQMNMRMPLRAFVASLAENGSPELRKIAQRWMESK
jgi:hypothetical protein